MVSMSPLAIDIENLPTLDEIEELIIINRQEMAELRKLKSLASLREKSRQPDISRCRHGQAERGECES